MGAGKIEELNPHIAELTSGAEANSQELIQLRTAVAEKV